MSRGGWFLAAWRWAPSLDWPGGAQRRRPPGCRGSGPGPPAGERGEASFGMLRNLLASPLRIPGRDEDPPWGEAWQGRPPAAGRPQNCPRGLLSAAAPGKRRPSSRGQEQPAGCQSF